MQLEQGRVFYAISLGHFRCLVSVHRCLWFSGIWGHFSNPLVSGLMGTPSKTRSARISIAWQELFAFVVACHLWANFFSNKRIQFFCDNESVVSIVNTKRSRIPRVMDLVRHLTLLTLGSNFCIRAEFIEGKRNDIADSLSRFQMDRFRELAPHAIRDPCLVPPELLKIYWQTSRAILICRLLILQSKPTVQGKKVLSSSSPSIGLCMLSLPTDEDTLIQYVAYLAKSVKHSTIKGYLAAVRHFHIRHGYQLNLKKFHRLHLVCRGIKRSQGSTIRTRLPITVPPPQIFLLPSSNQVHRKL